MSNVDRSGDISVAAARAAAQLARAVRVALADSELTLAGYRLLGYLATGDTAAKVLAAKLAISRPTVTATVDWLVRRGFAVRDRDEDDRRRIGIVITPRGRSSLKAADALVVDHLSEIIGLLEPDRAAEVVTALEDLGGALNQFRASGVDLDSDEGETVAGQHG